MDDDDEQPQEQQQQQQGYPLNQSAFMSPFLRHYRQLIHQSMDDIQMADASDTEAGGSPTILPPHFNVNLPVLSQGMPTYHPYGLAGQLPVRRTYDNSSSEASTASGISLRSSVEPLVSDTGGLALPVKPHIDPRIAELYPFTDLDVTPVPTHWSLADRDQYLYITPDKLTVYYNGKDDRSDVSRSNSHSNNGSAVRGNHSIPRSCGVYYYEISIRPTPRLPADYRRDIDHGASRLGIGIMERTVKLNRIPGWDDKTYAYHGDDGMFFTASGIGTPYGPKFGVSDTVGCGLNFVKQQIFFTKNGKMIGYKDIKIPLEFDYYPAIGMRYLNAAIHVNFGQHAFKFDIKSEQRAARNEIREAYAAYNLPPEKVLWMNGVVANWLCHAGYSRSAESFAHTTNLQLLASPDGIRRRHELVTAVKQGKLGDVISDIETQYADMLADNRELVILLRVQEIVDLAVSIIAKLPRSERVPSPTPDPDPPHPGRLRGGVKRRSSADADDEPQSSDGIRRSARLRGVSSSSSSDASSSSSVEGMTDAESAPELTLLTNGNSTAGLGPESSRPGHSSSQNGTATTIIAEDPGSSDSSRDTAYVHNGLSDVNGIGLGEDDDLEWDGTDPLGISQADLERAQLFQPVIDKCQDLLTLLEEGEPISAEINELAMTAVDLLACGDPSEFEDELHSDLLGEEHRFRVAEVLNKCILKYQGLESPDTSICQIVDALERMRPKLSEYSPGGIGFADVEKIVYSNEGLQCEMDRAESPPAGADTDDAPDSDVEFEGVDVDGEVEDEDYSHADDHQLLE